MKKIFLLTILLLTGVLAYAQKQNYVIGFYNVENLFDIYDDPAMRPLIDSLRTELVSLQHQYGDTLGLRLNGF